MDDKLSAARGAVYGVILGAALWLVIFAASAVAVSIFGYEPTAPACTSPLYGPGPDGPIVQCPAGI